MTKLTLGNLVHKEARQCSGASRFGWCPAMHISLPKTATCTSLELHRLARTTSVSTDRSPQEAPSGAQHDALSSVACKRAGSRACKAQLLGQ